MLTDDSAPVTREPTSSSAARERIKDVWGELEHEFLSNGDPRTWMLLGVELWKRIDAALSPISALSTGTAEPDANDSRERKIPRSVLCSGCHPTHEYAKDRCHLCKNSYIEELRSPYQGARSGDGRIDSPSIHNRVARCPPSRRSDMSGGSYDYAQDKLDEIAATLRANHPSRPHVVALADRFERMGEVMHAIEWADSGDTSWTPALDDAIRALLNPREEILAATTRATAALSVLVNVLHARASRPEGAE